MQPTRNTALLLILFVVHSLAAEEHKTNYLFEVTPFIGYSVGGEFDSSTTEEKIDINSADNYGLILGMEDQHRKGAFYELMYLQQNTTFDGSNAEFSGEGNGLDISYLHLGGRYSEVEGRLQPFVSGGFGITYLSAEHGDSKVKFSISLGGGIKYEITDQISFRLEARGFGTFFDNDTFIFCRNEHCYIEVDSDMIWQFTVLSALTISF